MTDAGAAGGITIKTMKNVASKKGTYTYNHYRSFPNT